MDDDDLTYHRDLSTQGLLFLTKIDSHTWAGPSVPGMPDPLMEGDGKASETKLVGVLILDRKGDILLQTLSFLPLKLF